MRDMVAGEAQLRSCDSNRKLTLGPNWILSPEGMVSNRLSSSTELRDSIHSGSMSPSQTIHDWISIGSRTTWRAAFVNTPSDHSRVSMSICPRSCWRSNVGVPVSFCAGDEKKRPQFISPKIVQKCLKTANERFLWKTVVFSWSHFAERRILILKFVLFTSPINV